MRVDLRVIGVAGLVAAAVLSAASGSDPRAAGAPLPAAAMVAVQTVRPDPGPETAGLPLLPGVAARPPATAARRIAPPSLAADLAL
jgi:hypothetical protein